MIRSIFKKTLLFGLFSFVAMPIVAGKEGYFSRLKTRFSNLRKSKSVQVAKSERKSSIGSTVVLGGIGLFSLYLVYKAGQWFKNKCKQEKSEIKKNMNVGEDIKSNDSSLEYSDVTDDVTIVNEINVTGDKAEKKLTSWFSDKNDSDDNTKKDEIMISKSTKKLKFSRPRRTRNSKTSVKQAKKHLEKKSEEQTNPTISNNAVQKPFGRVGIGQPSDLMAALKKRKNK